MKFYSFWRSLAAFRVRIALNIRGRAGRDRHGRSDEGRSVQPAYKAVNPQMLLPR